MFFLELYNNLSIMFDIYLIVSKARTFLYSMLDQLLDLPALV